MKTEIFMYKTHINKNHKIFSIPMFSIKCVLIGIYIFLKFPQLYLIKICEFPN